MLPAMGPLGALPQGPSPRYAPERLLTEHAVQRTMAREYFSLIGLISAHARGRGLLCRYGFWPLLEALCRVPARADLAQLTIHALSYTTIAVTAPAAVERGAGGERSTGGSGEVDGGGARGDATEARHVLALCCESPMADARLAAVRLLAVLATARVDGFGEFGLELLRNATSDTDVRVRHVTPPSPVSSGARLAPSHASFQGNPASCAKVGAKSTFVTKASMVRLRMPGPRTTSGIRVSKSYTLRLSVIRLSCPSWKPWSDVKKK